MFDETINFDEIKIVNGFAHKKLYMSNNRVKSLKVSVGMTGIGSGGDIEESEFTLEDKIEDYQSMMFDKQQCGNIVVFEINDIYKGQKYDDTCISEIMFCNNGNPVYLENIEEIKKARNAVLYVMSSEDINYVGYALPSFQNGTVKSFIGLRDGCLFLKRVDSDEGYCLCFEDGVSFSGMIKCIFYSASRMLEIMNRGERCPWWKNELDNLGVNMNL